MLKEGISHKINSEYCYPVSTEKLCLRLKTKKNDCNNINIWFIDKYRFIHGDREYGKIKLEKSFSDFYFDYYETIVPFKVISLSYFFEISNSCSTIYYGNYRFYTNPPGELSNTFVMAGILEEDIYNIPEWAKESIVYEIFPDRFNRGLMGKNTTPWYSPVNYRTVLGGTIKGITEKLDYLSDLGINTIYLTPIFDSTSNHKYNTRDYYKIDPQFGSLSELKEMVDQSHKKGMRVVLDGVFNHSGLEFFAFDDVIKHGEKSEYKTWFSIEGFPLVLKSPPNYKAFGYYYQMPKLLLKEKTASDYFLDVMTYWIKETDIDGWRLDVADEVSHSFWRKARERVKEVKSDVLIIGEVWYDCSAWLNGDEFDTVMNYKFFESTIDFIKNKLPPSQFSAQLGEVRAMYRAPVFDVLWNLIDSHDTKRFLTECNADIQLLKMAALFQMTYKGIPMIYYGTEVAMEGGADPDCRRPMNWHPKGKELEILEYYKKIITIRNSNKEFTHGDLRDIVTDDTQGIYGFSRCIDNNYSEVYFNNGNKDRIIHLREPLVNLLGNGERVTELNLPRDTGIILKR